MPCDRRIIDEGEFEPPWTLSKEAVATTTTLLKYLPRRER
jgi:hypothetical protein